MRLLDRINARSLEVLNPKYIILNMNTLSQLIDELEDEVGLTFSQDTLFNELGMVVLLSDTQYNDFILATDCE